MDKKTDNDEMWTKNDILKKLKENGIGMGKNPQRTFIYYQSLGLLPKCMARKGKIGVFPEWVYSQIRIIKLSQWNGHSLRDIKMNHKRFGLRRVIKNVFIKCGDCGERIELTNSGNPLPGFLMSHSNCTTKNIILEIED